MLRKPGAAQVDYRSGRGPRSDKGRTGVAEADLRLIAGVIAASTNKKGQHQPLGSVLSMLRAQGAIQTRAHVSTIRRQLDRQQLAPKQLNRPSASRKLASQHPNHVWQVDSTIGSFYYVPGNPGPQFLDPAEFNKNKLANVVRLSTQLLTRYSAVDHTSGAFKMQYTAGGESTENLLRFLVWAMDTQPGVPMHGVPLILMADQGSANKSKPTAAFCERLGIRLELHAPGNARATGAVEKTHHLAQMHLEPRFRFMEKDGLDIDALNALASSWVAAYCSSEIHQRHGRTRYGAWMEITKEQLRVASSDMLREAAVGKTESARVDGSLRITFRTNSYFLDQVPGVAIGDAVDVRPNYFRFPAIDVRAVKAQTGGETWHAVAPEQRDQWGFVGDNVIGVGHKALPDTRIDRSRKELLREAYRHEGALPTLEQAERSRRAHAPAFRGRIDPMADVNATQVPTYLPRQATPLDVNVRRVEPRRLNVVDVCIWLKGRMADAYTPQVFSVVSQRFSDGLLEDRLEGLLVELMAGLPSVSLLRAAGDA